VFGKTQTISSTGESLAAFYPLHATTDWPIASIHAAIAQLAVDLRFHPVGNTHDLHEDDAQQIVDRFVRDYRITRPAILQRLDQQRSKLLEQYERTEYRWKNDVGEIVLVLAKDNVIPFPDADMKNTGRIIFACGWVEFVMPDRTFEQLRIDDHVCNLPLLINNAG
jgi:hypothetical protein